LLSNLHQSLAFTWNPAKEDRVCPVLNLNVSIQFVIVSPINIMTKAAEKRNRTMHFVETLLNAKMIWDWFALMESVSVKNLSIGKDHYA
jgi:hypothetical protein